jgi:hypothetical protein
MLVKQEPKVQKAALNREEVYESRSSSEADVISQLRANLNQLEDLHGRLRHVMVEVRGVISKRVRP